MHVIELMKLFLCVWHFFSSQSHLIQSISTWTVVKNSDSSTLSSRLRRQKEKRYWTPLGASDWENRSVWRAVYLFPSCTHTPTRNMSSCKDAHVQRDPHIEQTAEARTTNDLLIISPDKRQKIVGNKKCLLHCLFTLWSMHMLKNTNVWFFCPFFVASASGTSRHLLSNLWLHNLT